MPDWQTIVINSLKNTDEATTYSSLRVIQVYSQKQPQEIMRHRLDFERPSSFFISQQAFDRKFGDLYDQWVSIEKQNYQNAGLWSRTEDERNRGVNLSLSVKNYVEILRSNIPDNYQVYTFNNKKYLLLEFKPPISGKLSPLLKDIIEYSSEPVQNDCLISIWIDIASELLTKTEVYVQDKIHGEVSFAQVFACYNEGIKVVPPPWLNTSRNPDGNLMITDQKLPMLSHFECREDEE